MTPADDPPLVRTQNLLLKNRLAEHGGKWRPEPEIAGSGPKERVWRQAPGSCRRPCPLGKAVEHEEELVKIAYVSEMAVIDSKLEVAGRRTIWPYLRASRTKRSPPKSRHSGQD
jgi:hypothetical protein